MGKAKLRKALISWLITPTYPNANVVITFKIAKIMAVEISPAGLSTASVANSLSLLVTYKEKLCRRICVVATNQPSATAVYTNETPVLNESTVFVPIVARVTITTPGCGCSADTQVFTERFLVAFQGQTALPTAVTITEVGERQGLVDVCCGSSNRYAINSSITVVITPGT